MISLSSISPASLFSLSPASPTPPPPLLLSQLLFVSFQSFIFSRVDELTRPIFVFSLFCLHFYICLLALPCSLRSVSPSVVVSVVGLQPRLEKPQPVTSWKDCYGNRHTHTHIAVPFPFYPCSLPSFFILSIVKLFSQHQNTNSPQELRS